MGPPPLWGATNPKITSALTNNTGSKAQLEAFALVASINVNLRGWEDLDCMQRMKFSSRVLGVHTRYIVTGGDVLDHFPCGKRDCSLCQNPFRCIYSLRCYPELIPVECTFVGCSQPVHHLCQINAQLKYGIDQRRFTCFRHNSNLQEAIALTSR